MKKLLQSLVLAPLAVIALVGCTGSDEPSDSNTGDKVPTGYTNEETPLIFSSDAVNGLFNPFYASSGPDSSVVGLTQISMIANDKDGNPVYGEDEPVVTLDLQTVTEGTGNNQTTTYYFVLKDNVKFSNGSALTIKDVLFNMYVYLDPAYTGSVTMYSTDIVGLNAYRTQSADQNEQDQFMQRFNDEAETRINNLLYAYDEIVGSNIADFTIDEFTEELENCSLYSENLIADFNKALELFQEELENDWLNSVDLYSDFTLETQNGTVLKPFTTDVEMFLYNEGYIQFNPRANNGAGELTFTWGDLEEAKTWTREHAIEMVYEDMIPNSIDQVISYWATSTELYTYLANIAMEEYFANLDTDREFANISGIKFANQTEMVTVNGIEYDPVEYNADGSIKDGFNEVLSITINGVDPKAIWNFAFSVAPMYYYSSSNWNGKDYISAFDFEANFGVEYGSTTFQDEVISNPDKNGVPVGAGSYMAANYSGGTENVQSGTFNYQNVIYFERNPYYIMGPAVVNRVRYQITSSNQMINSLQTGQIDYGTPNSTNDNRASIQNLRDQGIAYQEVQTSGYGYIGINASKVPSIKVRQAIMHSMDTSLTVNYYGGSASPIYRGMSLSSWAYPTGATAYYPYIGGAIPSDLSKVNPDYADFVREKGKSAGQTFTITEQIEFITGLVESAGYYLGSDGVYTDGTNILRYTFTIAGSETDHPAYNCFLRSQSLLNQCGFAVNATTDANALTKLNNGSLTVWAAAWSSTIDPDMYQVYHKESTAGSVRNWGYPTILQNTGNRYSVENAILDELSEVIEAARETNNQNARQSMYSDALDLVMELAIELPCYQRNDLFAYNTNKIDSSTLLSGSDVSAYVSPTNKNWLISLNEYK